MKTKTKLASFFLLFLNINLANSADQFASQIDCRDGVEQVSSRVINSRSFYSESPLMHQGDFYQVEFSQDRVIRIRDGVKTEFWKSPGCGPAAVTPYLEGFLVACYSSNQLILISDQGQLTRVWGSPRLSHSLMTPNDFVKDEWGGVYFTSSGEFNVAPEIPVEGRVYYLNRSGVIDEVASGIHYSNGIALSSDGRSLLVSEHFQNRILKYRVIQPGRLARNSDIFADLAVLFPIQSSHNLDYLGPDGMRQDQGVIFVAQYAGSRILKISESGIPIGVIEMRSQFPNTTNVWVDGDHLYLSAVRDDSHLGLNSVYPSVVVRIEDSRLRERAHLVCELD